MALPVPLRAKDERPQGSSWTPTLPNASAGSPTHLLRALHTVNTRGSNLSSRWDTRVWPGGQRLGPLPNLSPAPSAFQSLTNRRKLAEPLIFMNRNSIRQRFLWARSGGENEEARTKGPLYYLPRAGNCCSPLAAAGAAFIVLTHLRVKSYCALSLPVRGGLREEGCSRAGHLRGRRPPP